MKVSVKLFIALLLFRYLCMMFNRNEAKDNFMNGNDGSNNYVLPIIKVTVYTGYQKRTLGVTQL